jgi:hypothetical protein
MKSRMTRERHVRFRESLGVKFPGATRPARTRETGHAVIVRMEAQGLAFEEAQDFRARHSPYKSVIADPMTKPQDQIAKPLNLSGTTYRC